MRTDPHSCPRVTQGVGHRSDVTVLENEARTISGSPDGYIHHGAGQVVGSDYLIGEQHSKRGVDCAQDAVAEIRFLPRRHGVDIRGPEKVNMGEPRRQQCILGRSLVAREGDATSFRLVRAASAQE